MIPFTQDNTIPQTSRRRPSAEVSKRCSGQGERSCIFIDRVNEGDSRRSGITRKISPVNFSFLRTLTRILCVNQVDSISKDNDTSVSLDLSLILHQADNVMIPPQPSQDSFPKEAQVMDATSADAGVFDESSLHTLEKEKGEDSENVKMDFERSEEEIEKGSREEGSITQDNKQ